MMKEAISINKSLFTLSKVITLLAESRHKVGRCRLKPVEPLVESAWLQRLKLICDELDASLAFNFKTRRCNAGLHVPYRDSKLTSLLQDSLGGRALDPIA